MKKPFAYRLEWGPGEYCFYTPEFFEKEQYKSGARIWPLFTEPQSGCPDSIVVYKGWCWIQPKYDFGTMRDETFVPLYLGPLMYDPQAFDRPVTTTMQ